MKKLPKHMQHHACKVGKRVQLHPATDLWMMGLRYGLCVKIGRQYLTIKADANGKQYRVHPDNVSLVV